MQHIPSYSYVTNHINFNIAAKNLKFKINYTKNNLKILKIFKQIGFIRNYCLISNDSKLHILISLTYYKNFTICKRLKIVKKPTTFLFVSYDALCLISKRTGNSIFILSTDLGIVTHQVAIKNRKGGFVIGFFLF